MSIARVYTKGPVRKGGLNCGKCGDPIVKGQDRRRTFAVGFRGYEQTRCMKDACTPTRSELESSAVATIYGVIDDIDFSALGSREDLETARDDVVSACEEVADEYESNEMYEVNYDLQERAERIRSAGEELADWEPEDEEPEEDECEGHESLAGEHMGETVYCDGSCNGSEDLEGPEWLEWLANAQRSLEDAVNEMDLP